MNIKDTDISNRAKNICEMWNITTLEELSKMCEDTLKKTRQCDSKTTNELKQLLWKHKMRFTINPITKHRKALVMFSMSLRKLTHD
jgi:DNA-directed RNA polymerase alpha subunit